LRWARSVWAESDGLSPLKAGNLKLGSFFADDCPRGLAATFARAVIFGLGLPAVRLVEPVAAEPPKLEAIDGLGLGVDRAPRRSPILEPTTGVPSGQFGIVMIVSFR
jgi:hypothetical protein